MHTQGDDIADAVGAVGTSAPLTHGPDPHGPDHLTKLVDGLRDRIQSPRLESVAAIKGRPAVGQRPADAAEFMRAAISRDPDHQVRQHRGMREVRIPGIITAFDGCGGSGMIRPGRPAPVWDAGWREQ